MRRRGGLAAQMSRLTTTVATLVTCALIGTLPAACGGDKGQSGLTSRTWPTTPELGQQAPATPGAAGPSGTSAPTSPKAEQLPFKLDSSRGVAVDTKGTVYVTDGTQVLTLPTGSSTPTPQPPGDLKGSGVQGLDGVAVDGKGAIYVTDKSGHKVLRITADGNPTPLPPGPNSPTAVAVDNSGVVYVADSATNKVSMLLPGAPSFSDAPFPSLKEPVGVAVDNNGAVYVADKGAKQLWVLLPNSDAQPLSWPPAGRDNSPGAPTAVAVDGAGTAVYFVDKNKGVWKLALGGSHSSPVPLPFPGLKDGPDPTGIAVDAKGAVYVDDTAKVFKLPQPGH
jgi:streptogramin lyase